MKNSFIVLILLCFFYIGCYQRPAPTPFSYLHSLVDTLKINKEKNIFIYTVNPNDCINCLYGFSLVSNNMSHISNGKIYVMRVNRTIEKNELIKTSKGVSLRDSINKIVLWDKNVFKNVNSVATQKDVDIVSHVLIYNFSADSVIYFKPIKEIMNAHDLLKYANH